MTNQATSQPPMSKTPLMPAKLIALAINLTLGFVPSVLFDVWVERNCILPWNKWGFNFPLIDLKTQSLVIKLAWNFALFMLFGVFHSIFAQPEIHKYLRKLLPVQFIRTFFMITTGLGLGFMMACWQDTGIELYSLPLPQKKLDLISVTVFTLLYSAGNIYPLHKFGLLRVFGIQQIFQDEAGVEGERTEGTLKLVTNGMYGVVRHPMYTLTLAAFAVAPRMTLDRLWVVVLNLTYLFFAIPVEERKCIKTFGQAYLDYQAKVPAIFPKMSFFQRKRESDVKIKSN